MSGVRQWFRSPRVPAAMVILALAVACENPEAPALCGSIPEQTVMAGERTTVSACFEDANGDLLSYAASSSDPGVASVSVAGSTVTVTGVAPGTGLVTITATDATGLTGQQSFRVMVPNRAPVAVGEIASRDMPAGESASVDVSAHFREPDGQPLTYAMSVSDETVLAISAAGAVVTFEARAKGSATVTATATDPGGLSAVQSFVVTVPNRTPGAVGSIEPQTIEVDAATETDVSLFFTDPDGDDLVYTATSSDAAIAAAAMSGAGLTVTAIAKGEVTVTVTATDTEGLTATQSFVVTVPNRPPFATGSIEGRTIEVDEASSLDLARYFADPDGDDLVYTATSSDAAIAAAAMSGAGLTVTAIAKGAATVTVTATDTEGLAATQSFAVTVPNRPPFAAGAIEGQTIEVGGTATLELSSHFTDPDGDDLVYTAATSDDALIGASVEGGAVTATAIAKGEATVTITATDTEGLMATQAFAVTVPNRPPQAAGTIEARTLEIAERTTVELSDYFTDPDGDDLAYTVSSSDATLFTASLEGAVVTVEALAKGSAVVTVTATDTEGLTAMQEFAVSAANRPPHAIGPIEAQIVEVGESAAMELTRYFADPDGDDLAYTAATPEPSVINVSLSGGTVTVAALRKGEATVTVLATDTEGMAATQSFAVTVPNRTPEAVGTVPQMRVRVGGVTRADPSPLFADPDGDPLAFDASSSDPRVARAWMASNGVVVRGVKKGTTTVTITAEDPDESTATLQFNVRVDGSGGSNQPPFAMGTVGAQTLKKGKTRVLDASSYFSDPDGDNLTISATSSNTGVVIVTASGGGVELRGIANGTTSVRITATDPDGLSASLNVSVTVSETGGPNRPPVSTGTILDQDLGEGDKRMLNASSYFADPDDDDLSFTAESSDTEVVRTKTSGSEIELEVVSQGNATVTVTAEDPEGLETNQAFAVQVGAANDENRAPVAVGTIGAQELKEDSTRTLDASTYFTDPDSDALVFSAETSNPEVVTATVSGTRITLHAGSTGTATVTITAEDPSGLNVEQEVGVTVTEAESPNRAPVAGTVAGQTIQEGDSRTLDASSHFNDPDGDALTFSAESSNTGVVTATVSGSSVELQGVAEGTATVTITAEDPDGLSADAPVQVTIGPANPDNKAPTVKQEREHRTVIPEEYDVLQPWKHFEDPDDHYDDLIITASSSDPAIIRVQQWPSSVIWLHAESTGTATITVTASDPDDASVELSFELTVGNNAPMVINEPDDIFSSPAEIDTVHLRPTTFRDDDVGDRLSFDASSSDESVASVSIEASGVYGYYARVQGGAFGKATITLTATDKGGLTAQTTLGVTVDNNRPPRVTKAIPHQAFPTDDTVYVILSEHFDDPDGDDLSYSVAAMAPISASISSDTLMLTHTSYNGISLVRVTATDPGGRTAEDPFFAWKSDDDSDYASASGDWMRDYGLLGGVERTGVASAGPAIGLVTISQIRFRPVIWSRRGRFIRRT